MDRVLYVAMTVMVVLGMWETVGVNLLGAGYDYRETVAVWFRSIFWFSPDTSLMSGAPLVFPGQHLFNAARGVVVTTSFSSPTLR